MDGPATKCGYCGCILRGSCETILSHHCFILYDEYTDVISVDENAVVTIRKKHEIAQSEGTSERAHKEGTTAHNEEDFTLTHDELLIELIRNRKSLWDHRIPIGERTKTKKESQWQEIENIFGGALSKEAAKHKWKQLRDSYMKAKKKMRGYVRSGSGAESGHPRTSSFAHYEKMRFLDDTTKAVPTVSSIQHLLESSSSQMNDMQKIDMNGNLSDQDDLMQNLARPVSQLSETSLQSSSPRMRRKSDTQRQASIENHLLSILEETSHTKHDPVDGFLDQLGDILRRLSYIRRRNLQKRIMDLAIEEEDADLLEKENS